MELDISLQCLQVTLLIITFNQLNPLHALSTLSLRTILILFSVCVFQVVTLFKFHKKLSVVLLSLTHGTCHESHFFWFDENNYNL